MTKRYAVHNRTEIDEETNIIGIRLQKLIESDDGRVINLGWHRLSIAPDQNADDVLANVNFSLSSLEIGSGPIKSTDVIKQHVKREHTAPVVDSYKKSKPREKNGTVTERSLLRRTIINEDTGVTEFVVSKAIFDGNVELFSEDSVLTIDPIDDRKSALEIGLQQLESIGVKKNHLPVNKMQDHLQREFTKDRVEVAEDKRALRRLYQEKIMLEQQLREQDAQRKRDQDENDRKELKALLQAAKDNVR